MQTISDIFGPASDATGAGNITESHRSVFLRMYSTARRSDFRDKIIVFFVNEPEYDLDESKCAVKKRKWKKVS